MKVQIMVSGLSIELNQADQQRLRRVANVLRESGFDVEVLYRPQELKKVS